LSIIFSIIIINYKTFTHSINQFDRGEWFCHDKLRTDTTRHNIAKFSPFSFLAFVPSVPKRCLGSASMSARRACCCSAGLVYTWTLQERNTNGAFQFDLCSACVCVPSLSWQRIVFPRENKPVLAEDTCFACCCFCVPQRVHAVEQIFLVDLPAVICGNLLREALLQRCLRLRFQQLDRIRRGLHRLPVGPSCEKRPFLSNLYMKNDHFAKTASRQT
jgi:hypothetical protein